MTNSSESINKAIQFEIDLSSYTFDEKTLMYFTRNLEEADLYFLSLALIYTNLTNSMYGLPHTFLKKEEVASVLPYKERKYTRAFTRLEAMSIITVSRIGTENHYKITDNGKKVIQTRLATDVLFKNRTKEVNNFLKKALGLETRKEDE